MTLVIIWTHSTLFLNDPLNSNHEHNVHFFESSTAVVSERSVQADLNLLPQVFDLGNSAILSAITITDMADIHLSLVSEHFISPVDTPSMYNSDPGRIHHLDIRKTRTRNEVQIIVSASTFSGEQFFLQNTTYLTEKSVKSEPALTVVIAKNRFQLKVSGLELQPPDKNEWLVDSALNINWELAYLFGNILDLNKKIEEKEIFIQGARRINSISTKRSYVGSRMHLLAFDKPAPAYAQMFVALDPNTAVKSSFDDGETWVDGIDVNGVMPKEGILFDVPRSAQEMLLKFDSDQTDDLPIELFVSFHRHNPMLIKSLEASTLNDIVFLDWVVSSNSYKNGFEIQRSTDGLNWKSLGYVPSALSDVADIQYTFEDDQPAYGSNYYRLIHRRTDKQMDQSEVIKLNLSPEQNEWQASIRKKTKEFIIPLAIQAKNSFSFEIFLSDRFGCTWQHHKQKHVTEGLTQLELPLPKKIPSGTYYLHFNSDGKSKIKQVRI